MRKIFFIVAIPVVLLVIGYWSWKQFEFPLPARHILSQLPRKYGVIASAKENAYLIRNVSIVPMNLDTVLLNHNVLVIDGKISAIKRSLSEIDTSSHPVSVEGTGKYLIPGLNDMHVHVNDDNNLLLFIANGVTTIRNMAGFDFHLKLREEISKGEILGPTFYTVGPILEGSNPVWNFSIVLKNKMEARDAVLTCKMQGYDFVKVYHTLSPGEYKEILRVADSIGIPVVGHIPFDLKLSETLALTQYSLEHIDLRPIDPGIPMETREEMIGASRKWVCPTLVVYRNIQRSPDDPILNKQYADYVDADTRKFWDFRFREPEDVFELQKKMAKGVFSHGGRFIAGTDCLNSYVLAGFSLHEELEELVHAGLTPFEALESATIHPATFLKREGDIGTIEAGKLADLVLLDGNPLIDITNTKKIQGVMVKGKWFTADELHGVLEDVKKAFPE